MKSFESQKDFNVAVVGGGICGLAVAVGLRKAGIEVDIYEAAVSLRNFLVNEAT